MSMTMIILLPVIAGLGLLYWAESIKEEQEYLATAFRFMFLPLIFLSIHFAVIDATLTYASDSDLVALLGDMSYYLGWLMFIVGVYYCFIAMAKAYDIVLQKRAEKQERYDD